MVSVDGQMLCAGKFAPCAQRCFLSAAAAGRLNLVCLVLHTDIFQLDTPSFLQYLSVAGEDHIWFCTQTHPTWIHLLSYNLCLWQVKTMSQDIRNDVGSLLLRLTIRELFDWPFMQTDPNWGNFLYDEHADQLHLIDFGAAKEYPKPFVDDYLRMVLACADKNRDEVIMRSTKLKFLTGESDDAGHIQAALLIWCKCVAHLV